jgi:hypothetical protein
VHTHTILYTNIKFGGTETKLFIFFISFIISCSIVSYVCWVIYLPKILVQEASHRVNFVVFLISLTSTVGMMEVQVMEVFLLVALYWGA